MKTLACSDVSGQACDFVAKAEDANGAKSMLKDHGMEAHKEMMEGMSEEQMAEMGAKMDEMMKDAE